MELRDPGGRRIDPDGNLDAFRYDREGYHLEGDWGEVRVIGGDCRINVE